MTGIGALIKEARKRKGYSQERLAELIPCDSKMISRYENNEVESITEIMKRITEILDLRIEINVRNRIPKQEYSFSEIKNIEDKLLNYKDKLLVRLFFETPIYVDIDNIKYLKITDLDETNKTLSMRIHEKKVEVPISDELVTYIKNAHNENVYDNKVVIDRENKKEGYSKTELEDSEYLFKGKKGDNLPLQVITFYHKMGHLRDYLKLEKFDARCLWISGMLYMASKLRDRDGKLEIAQMEEILERYHFSHPNPVKDKLQFLKNNIIRKSVLNKYYK